MDPDLTSTIGRGDVGAFERLFRAHYAALCRFAMRFVREPARAEDIVQFVFTTLWVNRATWTVAHSEKAYLFAAVRNAAINDQRYQAVRRDWEQEEAAAAELDPPASPAADAPLLAAEATERVATALATLPARCRLVMELRWQEQLSHAEIAEVMGISIKGVENQLSRGLARLRTVIR